MTDDTITRVFAACLAIAEAVAAGLLPIVAAVVALALTVGGWKPGAARSPVPATPLLLPSATAARTQLTTLPVRELRQLARAAGHRSLARSGRRADLLAALEVA